MAHVAAWVVNLAIVYLAFGLWFYLLTSFGQVRELGMVGYFKERSLIFCWSGRFVRNLKRKYGQFEEQILHVDLGEKENKTVFRVVAVNFVILACIPEFVRGDGIHSRRELTDKVRQGLGRV